MWSRFCALLLFGVVNALTAVEKGQLQRRDVLKGAGVAALSGLTTSVVGASEIKQKLDLGKIGIGMY